VIGIGYPTESGFMAAMAKRNRDYAPTDGGDYARAVLNSTVAPGGAAFLRFIREELKPSLQAPELVRANAVQIAENSPMVRAQVESIIAWSDKHGWPRTTDLPHELAARLRSRNYAGLKIHSHTKPDEIDHRHN
jgi:hypothetical protein